jgi:hypothetical protein
MFPVNGLPKLIDERLRGFLTPFFLAPTLCLRLCAGGLHFAVLLHFFIAALKALRAALGVVIFVRLIAETIHFLIPLLDFPLLDLHTHFCPPTVL